MSLFSWMSLEIPCPSLPKITTYLLSLLKLISDKNFESLSRDVLINLYPLFFNENKKSLSLETTLSLKMLPWDDWITLNEYFKAQPFDKITSLKPKAKAVLKIVPTFPGSCTLSKYKTLDELISFSLIYFETPITSVIDLFCVNLFINISSIT